MFHVKRDIAPPLLLALLLGACEGAINPLAPPVVMTRTLAPGDEVVCTETLVRIGLPVVGLQVIGFAMRTFRCELRPKSSGPSVQK